MSVYLEVAEKNASQGFPAGEEVFLKVTMDGGGGNLFTKRGAFVAGQGRYQFEPVLLGPQGNPLQAIAGQVMRRLTGENMPLTKVITQGQSLTYYACDDKHITVVNLNPGESIYVESEDLLAFNDACNYSLHPLLIGVISQKGMFTSAITGKSVGAQVAILTDGNPLMLQTPCRVDPDAMVAFTGADPTIHLDMSLKMLLGQTSGETYMLDYTQAGGVVIIQPVERKSGIDISVDSKYGNQTNNYGGQSQSIGQAAGNVGNALNTAGNALNGLNGSSSNNGSSLGGLGSMLGGLFK